MPGTINNQVFFPPIFQPRRVEPFMDLYEGVPTSAGVEYMAMFTDLGYARAEHDTGLAVNGNLEIRLDAQVDTWLAATATIRVLVARAFLGNVNFVWYLGMGEAGALRLHTQDTANVQRAYVSNQLTWTAGSRWQVRATLNIDNGGGSSIGSLYRRAATVGLEEDSGWASIGGSTFSSFTALKDISAPVETMGREFTTDRTSATGRLYRFMLYDGIGGTVVSDLNFDDASPAETEVWDDQAQLRLWTMQGVEGIDWLHSTSDTVSVIPGGILQLEGGVTTSDLNPPSSEIPGGVLQLVGGRPREFLPQNLAVTVNGVEHTFLAGSLVITMRGGGRSTLNIDIKDPAATADFSFNQEIKVYGLEGEVIFAGWIDTMESTSWHTENGTSEGMIHKIGAKDNHYLADKRIVFGEFGGIMAGTAVERVLNDYLSAEGITAGTIEDGELVSTKRVDGQKASDVIQEFADMSEFVWKIDADRTLHFRPRTSVTAPMVSVGTGMLRGTVRRKRQNQQYRNRQFVIGNSNLSTNSVQKTETFSGNGSRRVFSMRYYISFFSGGGSSVVSVRVNGEDQSFKRINGSYSSSPVPDGTVQWYWSQVRRELVQDPSETVLTSSDELEITFLTRETYRSQDFLADGVARTYKVASPYHAVSTTSANLYVDYGSGWAHETISPLITSGTTWVWNDGTTDLIRGQGIATVPAGSRIRLIWSDANTRLTTDVNDPDEIARNKAVEGGTTSGIVETIGTSLGSGSADEALQKAEAELRRHAHDTETIEFQTWNSDLTDGEIAPVLLEDFGIDAGGSTPVNFLIEQVVITHRPTSGQKDTQGSPLVYRVTAGRCLQCTDTTVGSHQRFSEVLGGLKSVVRS